MRRKRIRIVEQAKYFLERQFIKGASYQLLFVAALIGFISLIGGFLVYKSEGIDKLDESIWWAFLRLTDPGYLGDDEGVWKRLISTIITIAGYVLFLGSLVAIITTWLNRKIRDLEKGLTPVAANNHLVILGWTNRTIHIAGELFQSQGRVSRFLKLHKTRNLKLIILSEEVGPALLTELKENRNIGRKAHRIVLRSGTAIDREHLRRVDILNAATIIIPSYTIGWHELITPDVETIKTLLSIHAEADMNQSRQHPYVVAEIQDENKIKAAKRAYGGPLETIASNTIISRLIAQNVRHAGLTEIYNEILARSIKNDLFTRNFPELENLLVKEVKKLFPKAIIIGVVTVKSDTKFIPMLNIPEGYQLKKSDRLVLLAKESSHTDLINKEKIAPGISMPMVASTPVATNKKLKQHQKKDINKKMLILGWNNKVPALISEFGSYAKETYHIDIVSLRPIAVREKALELLPIPKAQLTFTQIEGDYVKEAEMKKIKPSQYDNIIFVSTDKLEEEEEADARTIVGYILLEEILSKESKTKTGRAKQQPKVLLELADPNNESMIKRFNSNVIISPMIISHILAQVALQRELHSIYNQLFTVGGPEIIFRKPSEYNITESNISFAAIEQHAVLHNETAIGIYSLSSKINEKDQHILNPSADYLVDINSDTAFIVLTTVR